MWNLRRCILPEEMPLRRNVIQFVFHENGQETESETKNYWAISRPGAPVDVCFIDPKFDVDLFVVSDLRAMASAFFGHTELSSEIANDGVQLIGNPTLARTISKWFILSSYARSPHAHTKRNNIQPRISAG